MTPPACPEEPSSSACQRERHEVPQSPSAAECSSGKENEGKTQPRSADASEHKTLSSDAPEDDAEVDVARAALYFSVHTQRGSAYRRPKAQPCEREEGYKREDSAAGDGGREGECATRLQKVVDKKEFNGDEELPLAELLEVSEKEGSIDPRRVTRTDIYRRGRVPWSSSPSPSPSPAAASSAAGSGASSEREEVRDVFVLEGVFSAAECEWLRRRVEDGPQFTYWDSTGTASSQYRSAYTAEVHHPALADLIWERIKDWVIKEVTISEDDEARAERDLVGDWIACGVNPHLLFARYTDGAHFGPHTDGCTALDFNTRTLWPAVLYLNDVADGGETLVIDDAQKTEPMVRDKAGRHTADPRLIVDAVEARTGRMLLFYHTQMHEGRRVGPGASKYIIRTDVLYRRKTPLLTAPQDQDAYALWRRAELLAEEGQTDEAAALFRRSLKLSPDLAAIYGMA
ncbi:tetratricopeptide repeat-containing protein [Besnoitia besnoiti]|uniref:Tetratricopeptide repeat-containing protein n=1 Tax=Besnoitia besnoiti TaxID=94643 RepID=A0A2A9MQL1_BESBE|nr:tetratricopeptide repeat-containing protein [Besnoitia besnoiti]PFH38322.1 tetratricopeptide repeat-containing protein [Besnoitia besnoiti]